MKIDALILAILLVCGCSRQPESAKQESASALSSDEHAPDSYKVRLDTSKGTFVITVYRSWAPLGADRFYTLVKSGFFNGARFFRVLPGFVVQFGIAGDPAMTAKWRNANLQDDPVTQSNRRGTLSFATGGPNTRTTQVFINLADNSSLDAKDFSPFGAVSEGMNVVDQLYSGYGEGAPQGTGPSQPQAESEGNRYFERDFPKLDYIQKATIEK